MLWCMKYESIDRTWNELGLLETYTLLTMAFIPVCSRTVFCCWAKSLGWQVLDTVSDSSGQSIGQSQPWEWCIEGASVTGRGIGHRQNHYIITGSSWVAAYDGPRVESRKNSLHHLLPCHLLLFVSPLANWRVGILKDAHKQELLNERDSEGKKMCLIYFSIKPEH